MLKKFYLVRHGDFDARIGDPGLNLIGRQKAIKTGAYLKKMGIDCLYASPLQRTLETARLINHFLKLKLKINKLIRERLNWGDSGISFAKFLKDWEFSSINRNWSPDWAQSSKQASQRLQGFLRKLTLRDEANYCLVSHGGIISDFLRDMDLGQIKTKLSKFHDIEILQCSISKLEWDGNQFKIEYVNSIKHLENA